MSNLSVKAGDFCWVPKVAQGMRLYESLKLMALSISGLSFLGLGISSYAATLTFFGCQDSLHERSLDSIFSTQLCDCLVQGWGQIGRISASQPFPGGLADHYSGPDPAYDRLLHLASVGITRLVQLGATLGVKENLKL